MSFYKVTLKRSLIGLPKATKLQAKALGLNHGLGKTVFKPVSAGNAGNILKLKELVSVELVDKPKSKKQMREERKSKPGFVVEKSNGASV